MTFRILVLCTGNVCRSPVAEHLLSSALGAGFEVASRGTQAWPGQPFAPEMAALLHERMGMAVGTRGAVRLTPADVRAADLVLGMERGHRAAAVRMHPAAVRRAFTLTEFARLASAIEPPPVSVAGRDQAMADAVGRAHQGRRPVPPELDEIVDPIGQPAAVYEAVFDQIDVAVRRIARVIGAGE
ncbi:MAG TPA: hypothetical protein VFN73_06300 [Propionibacteriaceae bacterium]|nr:hypothetical protein [Propionibacteriaceae bacterium]